MTTPLKKLMLTAFAAFAICLGTRADSTHDMVQLWEGGPYWATTNVGAENPEDYGYYFWWGDTVGYKRENGKWVASDGSSSNFSFDSGNTPTYYKSVATLQSEGWITADGVLVPEHDAAHIHWGGNWRMPTNQELDDLNSKCDWAWTTMNGVNGYIVRGRGDYAPNSIFLPCVGFGDGTPLYDAGSVGYYWSSVPYSGNWYDAWILHFGSGYHSTHYGDDRNNGQSVRPVWQPVDLSKLEGAYTAQDGDVLTGELGGNFKVSIADGATIQIRDVRINEGNDSAGEWAGITCEGDACLVIEGANYVKGFYTSDDWGYPGVSVPEGKTLTISGTGALEAWGQVHCAGIGGHHYATCGNIVIESGTIIAYAGHHAAGIGAGNGGHCGDITINGGVVKAYGGDFSAAIGGVVFGDCGDITINGGDVYARAGDERGTGIGGAYYGGPWGAITIGENITKVVVYKIGDIGWHIGGGTVNIPSEEILKRTYSSDGNTLTLEPAYKWNITWRSDEGELIEVTIVNGGAMPEYADQEKAADSPYRNIFTGWSPALALAVSNTTYTATFKKVVDLSLLTDHWTAADGDEIVGTTAHKVTIPGGATVTINGIEVAGAGGGGADVPAPTFAEGGESVTAKFEKKAGEGNVWTITAFAEMSNESRGTDVEEGQIKVYRAGSLADLKTAEAMTEGVTLKEKSSAVKVTLEAEAPTEAEQQFFRVDFGD